MIASHRKPSTWLMAIGCAVLFFGVALPFILSPASGGVLIAAVCVRFAGAIILACGGCVYARGTGYPAWLGVFSLTFIGLLMLLWLPDRCPSPEDDES